MMIEKPETEYSIRRLFVHAPSPNWRARIRSLNLSVKLAHVLSLNSLMDEAREFPGNLALVELPTVITSEWARHLLRHVNQPQTPLLIGLGTSNGHLLNRELSFLGIAQIVLPEQYTRISKIVAHHYQEARIPTCSAECYIEANLPWPENGD